MSKIDVRTVLLIGLVIAIATGAAGYGIAYILTVILCGRLPLLRSRLWGQENVFTAEYHLRTGAAIIE
jgi:hypothetical protein